MTKNKKTKRALITSALSVLLCFALLIGSTFAWFSDNATVGVNSIQAGELKVDLVDSEGNSLVGQTLDFVKLSGHENEPILWEPGATYSLPEVYVKNNGNLALKYKLAVSGIDGDAKLLEAIEWTITLGGVVTDLDSFEGHLSKDEQSSDALVLTGHMKETAGNEYQNLTADGISIIVVATQDTEEYDTTTNQYDKDASYPDYLVDTVGEFKAAMTSGGHILMVGNVTVPSNQLGGESGYGKSGISQTKGGIIDGNGKTLTVEGANTTWDAAIYTKGGTIRNITINGAFRGIFIAYPIEDIIIDSVTINPIAYAINCDSGSGKKLIVTNSTINGWTSFTDTLASATFTDCRFGSNGTYAYLRPYCPTTLTNCEFEEGFEMDATKTSEITLVNCTYNGTPITAANLTSLLGADAAGATVR